MGNEEMMDLHATVARARWPGWRDAPPCDLWVGGSQLCQLRQWGCKPAVSKSRGGELLSWISASSMSATWLAEACTCARYSPEPMKSCVCSPRQAQAHCAQASSWTQLQSWRSAWTIVGQAHSESRGCCC